MVLVRPMSDLHVDVTPSFTLKPLPTDKDTILTLAGDIYNPKKLMPWLHQLSGQFKHVVACLGNHDYWKGSYDKVRRTIRAYKEEHKLTNIHVLLEEHVVLEGYLFFGGTLWTDYNRRDPMTYLRAPDIMKDFKKIRTNNYLRRLTTGFILQEHQKYVSRLTNLLADEQYADLPVMVMSHHAPCTLSLDPKYADQRIDNGCYASDLTDLILDNPRIKLWQHGHVHKVSYYPMGDTYIVCNPSGYNDYGDWPKGFSQSLVLDLDNLPDQI